MSNEDMSFIKDLHAFVMSFTDSNLECDSIPPEFISRLPENIVNGGHDFIIHNDLRKTYHVLFCNNCEILITISNFPSKGLEWTPKQIMTCDEYIVRSIIR